MNIFKYAIYKKVLGGKGEVTEKSTETEMNALLETAEVGTVFKYVGETTDDFENGALYIVEEV